MRDTDLKKVTIKWYAFLIATFVINFIRFAYVVYEFYLIIIIMTYLCP